MQGKTHMIVGVSSLCLLTYLYPDGISIHNQSIMPQVALITAAVGSYLPDIDIPQSKLGQKYTIISKHLKHRGFTHTLVIPAILLLALVSCAFLSADNMMFINALVGAACAGYVAKVGYGIIKHGQADLYDFIQCIGCGYALIQFIGDLTNTVVVASLIFGLLFGWTMHIIADMCNYKGTPLLPGMSHVHIMSVTTGTWQEAVWLCCYLALACTLAIMGAKL